MKKILIAGAVFLTAGVSGYFLMEEKGRILFEDPSAATVFQAVALIPPDAEIIATGTQTIIKHHGVYIYFVNYENDGFNPKDFKIPAGNSARFINKSNKALRVYSKNQSAPYNVLNQPSSMGKGGVYNFNFTTRGFWEFYNLNNPDDKGSITVY